MRHLSMAAMLWDINLKHEGDIFLHRCHPKAGLCDNVTEGNASIVYNTVIKTDRRYRE